MKRILYLAIPFLLLATARGQTPSKPNIIIAGPRGVPRMVKNESETWSVPIQVYSDAKMIVYIPDITTPGWAQWHATEFRTKGTYLTYLYVYLRKTRGTTQELVHVNTREQTAIVQEFMQSPILVHLARDSQPALDASIKRTTELVNDCVQRFNGPSIQSYLENDRYVALRNSLCAAESPDCSLSLDELRKKYPSRANASGPP